MRRRVGTGGKAAKKGLSKSVPPRRAARTAARRGPSAAELQKQLTEALEQQAATSAVLKVISSSPGELEPVFRAMLENAIRICEAKMGDIFRFDGNALNFAASVGTPPELAEFQRRRGPFQPVTGGGLDRVMRTKQVVHAADNAAEAVPTPAARLGGARSTVWVPMLKDDVFVGAISIYRQEIRPFTDKQIALLQNFAAQAVIAIENTRLLNELRQRTDDLTESLEQQTATSEVLNVISGSVSDAQPVFDTIVHSGMKLFPDAVMLIALRDGDTLRAGAFAETDTTRAQTLLSRWPIPLTREYNHAIAILDRKVIDIPDAREAPAELAPGAQYFLTTGYRAITIMPMMRGGDAIGALSVVRSKPGPLSDKQVSLLRTFADQAVIAIENARLLNELRESLQQQTATSEVLSVISRSPGALEPVFNAMLANATRICQARFANLSLFDGERFENVTLYNAPIEYASQGRTQFRPHPKSGLGHVARTKQIAHIEDIRTQPPYREGDPADVALADLGGARTVVIVPMLKERRLVGTIAIYRQEVRPFSEKQIELLTNFAAQAVIAIENTRLLSELREALQQQTATADVLKVISRSTFDLHIVLDTLLRSAGRLCDADMGAITQRKGDQFYRAVSFGIPPKFIDLVKDEPVELSRSSGSGRVLLEGKVVHIDDVEADPEYTWSPAQQIGGFHTLLGVPMLRDGVPVGVLTLMRAVIQPFTAKQIELVSTFADQAAIAIENVRLFDVVQKRTQDLAESLEQQTATSDVLEVISRSAFDLQPVFETVAESCVRLCGADRAFIFRFDGEFLRMVAAHNSSLDFTEWVRQNPIRPGRHSGSARAALERRTIHIPDVLADSEYTYGAKTAEAIRTILGVPILKGDELLGVMMIYRLEVRPFTDKQIALVETFAEQAAIAIENVRLFDEIQDKSRQLAEASQHKSQFLANMSHELRTPLNAILGYTELIADGIYGVPAEKMQAVLKRVESNGKHLLGLINAVLDLSKIEAGQLVLDLADYSLGDVAHTVFSAVEPLAADKKLTFKAEVARDLPQGRGDERRLTQVLLNLVGNAIKFTDAGEVVIKASASDRSFDLSVRDTGPGISPADQAKLFQEFRQADNSLTRKKGGTGLGLAISKRIIEMHGGRIWVESAVGQGSIFACTIPVRVEQQVKVE
jgi:GAF domain-containing protein